MNVVMLSKDVGNGRYSDVIDACEELGRRDYGSASNALAVMVRQSKLYQKTAAELGLQRPGIQPEASTA